MRGRVTQLSIPRPSSWFHSMPVSKKPYATLKKEEFSSAADTTNQCPCVVRTWRETNDDCKQSETFPGWLDIQLAGIVVPSKDIKRLVESEGLLSGDDADLFASAVRSAFYNFKSVIEDDLAKEVIGRVTESPHPLVADYTLLEDREVMDGILYTLDQLFYNKEDEIRDFIKKHRDYLMTIRVVRKYRVLRGE